MQAYVTVLESTTMPWLINAAQLDKFRKNQKALMIFDASWFMPNEGRVAKQEFLDKHIVGAQFFDIDAFNDPDPKAAHKKMILRDETTLSDILSNLGIRSDFKIILYDNSSLHTSARALWILKLLGHDPQLLYILDGGLDAWLQYGGKTESGETLVAPKPYTVQFQERYLRTLPQMKDNLQHPREQIIDVRHAVRYAGGPEDRPGLRPGHIPGSFSFPFTSLFDAQGRFKSLDKIRIALLGCGINLNSPIVTSCGSGTTATILNFVLDLLNHPTHAVYNGSWTEWGKASLLPGETSLAERPVATCIDD